MTEMLLIWGMLSQLMQARIKVGTPLASGTVVSQIWWQYIGSSVSPPYTDRKEEKEGNGLNNIEKRENKD